MAITADAVLNPAAFALQARRATALLPVELREQMEDFIVYGDGGLVLTGVIVGDAPPTPESAINDITHKTLLAKELAVVLSVICHLAGFRAESGGALIQSLLPTKADRYEQTSTGSHAELLAHTEQAFSDFRPDYLGLACFRGDPHAITYLLSARALVRHLPGRAIELLQDKAYYTGVDTSFIRGGAVAEDRGPMAVLGGPLGDPLLRYDGELMYSPSPEHQEALELVHAVYLERRVGVALKAGDILVVDNSRSIHGRSPFRPQWDRGDRYICRAQGHASLASTRRVRLDGSPVIESEGS
ncbi:Taurine catabolism dioxygenase TauD, TfdA family (plasmid) [Mycobacterium sp. JS623]|nr:Taurine catabolism dioxygenase TauD, TfdA family [Mycobacterium sp. JS623]